MGSGKKGFVLKRPLPTKNTSSSISLLIESGLKPKHVSFVNQSLAKPKRGQGANKEMLYGYRI